MSPDPRTAHAFHEIIHQALAQKVKLPVIIVATTRSHKGVNSDLADGFLHQLEIQVCDKIRADREVKV